MDNRVTTIYDRYGEALRYLVVGGLTTAINIVLFFQPDSPGDRLVLGQHRRLGAQRPVCFHCEQKTCVWRCRHDPQNGRERSRQLLHAARGLTAS